MNAPFQQDQATLVEFEVPEGFHDIPLLLPPELFEPSLAELAEKIWPGGTEFQREVAAAVYRDMAQALEEDGTLHASIGLFETDEGGVSTANLLVRRDAVQLDAPDVAAASLHEMLSLEEHREVHEVDLACGPAVVSFHAAQMQGGLVEQPLVFAHIELYVPSPFGGDLLVVSLSTPSLAELPVYVGTMSRFGDTIRFSRETGVDAPADGAADTAEQKVSIDEETRSVFG